MKPTGLLLAAWIIGGCTAPPGARMIDHSHGAAVNPDAIEWSQEQRASDIAVLEWRRGNWSSEHIVRLAGAETPHVHQRHDVTVTLLRGRVRLHIGDQVFEMRPGDVATIPHGATHWAQNVARGEASLAYAVFTPPFDGRDTVPAGR